MAYNPGRGRRVCLAIAQDEDRAFQYTIKRNTVAVVSDGTAVLGLGDIGPGRRGDAGDGGQVLACFKEFRGRGRVPDLPETRGMRARSSIRSSGSRRPFRGDQPRGHLRAAVLWRSRDRLKAELDIPIFHDDQHGTAVVVMAALMNAVQADGQADERAERADHRSRRGGDRGHEDPAGGGGSLRSSARTPGERCTPSREDLSSTGR